MLASTPSSQSRTGPEALDLLCIVVEFPLEVLAMSWERALGCGRVLGLVRDVAASARRLT